MNKKILEQPCQLPSIPKRETTQFDEFQLSKSNKKLAKRTIEEYLTNKENHSSFKARSLDRKILEEATFRVHLSDGKKRVTSQSPFKLMTEERGRNKYTQEEES